MTILFLIVSNIQKFGLLDIQRSKGWAEVMCYHSNDKKQLSVNNFLNN